VLLGVFTAVTCIENQVDADAGPSKDIPRFTQVETSESLKAALEEQFRPLYLTYHLGPILRNVQIVALLWGGSPSSFLKEFDPASPEPNLFTFYRDLVKSRFWRGLREYAIGEGDYLGAYRVPIRPASSVRGLNIVEDLALLIESGAISTFQGEDVLYAIHLPKNVTVELHGNHRSCTSFCSYHDTFTWGQNNIRYAVFPDLSGCPACSPILGLGPTNATVVATPFQTATTFISHEIYDAVTDPDPGRGWTTLPSPRGNEIGDLCNGFVANLTAWNGVTYTAQTYWSNRQQRCTYTAC